MQYPIGIQSFKEIREGGYLYIDKTKLIYDIVRSGKYYFLSRPRRFGKSLLISTLEAYFRGKKELFEGLAMEKLETEWVEYPVLHLDLNTEKYDTEKDLENKLDLFLKQCEAMYGKNPDEYSLATRFEGVIRRASEKTGRNTVILVDEYEKPLLQAVNKPELQDEYRNTLKAFYGALKSMDRYIRFALLTGVTKFGKVSVFSDLNNLMDMSMDFRYSDLCGITEEELHSYFREDIKELGAANGMTEEETKEKLKEMYDGYHFNEKCGDIYNPFSLLNTFAKKQFGSYWFETGTPTYLVELLKQNKSSIEELDGIEIDGMLLESIDATATNPIPVIYQSGYLTIKGYDREFNTYILGYPNKEVEQGFLGFILPYYATLKNNNSGFEVKKFVMDVRSGNIEAFMKRLQTFFADTPYELVRDLELHYQNVMYILFKLLGFYTRAEYHTSEGRIDMVVKTADYIYVMEFKLDGTAEEAMEQINGKNYPLPFESDGRKVVKVGVNFSNEMRNIERWVVE